ncbi:MAG TPA: helix-turn-helix transcriptional regulator, partial [Pseudomonadota bacterium]|nr:helix-turn-helix transcriptional regulator [Pseudomonadota bacterium]
MTASKGSGRATLQSTSQRTSASGRRSRPQKRPEAAAPSSPPPPPVDAPPPASSQTPGGGRPEAALPNVGINLRLLREERGLTLQELAERSGVSKAMLNQIEGGK